MELLLWLWFYNKYFFFGIESTIQFYKNSWILPFIYHIVMIFICFYYIYLEEKNYYNCDISYHMWHFFSIFIHLIFSLILISFRFQISKIQEKESKYFSNSKKILPEIRTLEKKIYYWIKQKTLQSYLGLLILFFSIIYFFGSITIILIYDFELDDRCDKKLKNILFWYSILYLITNSPFIFCGFIMLISKVFPCFFYIFFSKNFNRNYLVNENLDNMNLYLRKYEEYE